MEQYQFDRLAREVLTPRQLRQREARQRKQAQLWRERLEWTVRIELEAERLAFGVKR